MGVGIEPDSGPMTPEFKSQLYLLLTMPPWAASLNSLCFSFLIY